MAKQGRFRIQAYIAAGIVSCSIGGLALAALLVLQARGLDADARLVDDRSAVTRDVAHLATLVRQWLVTIDLVTGHNGSYLWEGAQDQANEIGELLVKLEGADLVRRISGDVATLREASESAQAAVVAFAFLEPGRSDDGGALLDRIDTETTRFVLGIEELAEALEIERSRMAREIDQRRARFVPFAAAMGLAYLLLVVCVWRWSVLRLARPILRLTEEASGHGSFSDPTRRAPVEIALLAQGFQRFASSLESEKAALAESEASSRDEAARSHAIMEATPSAIIVVDAGGRILAHNEATRRMLAADGVDLTGRASDEFFRGEILAEGRREIEGVRVSGEAFPVELATARFEYENGTAYALVGHDRTEHQRLEFEVRQSQKQRALGQLAAGLAHELNTPIQFVGDCIHFYRDAFSDLAHLLGLYRDETRELPPSAVAEIQRFEAEIDLPFLLDEIPAAGERTLEGLKSATELIRATQELVHPGGGGAARCDVADAVRSASTLAQHRIDPVADLDIQLAPLPPVECGHGELVQVLVNLLSNGADAIASARPERRGLLRIEAAREGDTVCIAIADDGPGIPLDVRERMFDPFFTTKEVGSGTGQGLSIARSIVNDRYGGSLSCLSKEGVGTVFEIRLQVAIGSGDA